MAALLPCLLVDRVDRMLQDLTEQCEDARALFDKASDLLGYDLLQLCMEGAGQLLSMGQQGLTGQGSIGPRARCQLCLVVPHLRRCLLRRSSSSAGSSAFAGVGLKT